MDVGRASRDVLERFEIAELERNQLDGIEGAALQALVRRGFGQLQRPLAVVQRKVQPEAVGEQDGHAREAVNRRVFVAQRLGDSEGLLPVGQGAVHALMAELGEIGERPHRHALIAGRARGLQRGLGVRRAAAEIAAEEADVAPQAQQLTQTGVVAAGAQLRPRLQRPVGVLEGLLERVHAEGRLRGQRVTFEGPLGASRFRPVMGEQAVTVGRKPFQRLGRAGVKVATVPAQERAVGRLLDQAVLEEELVLAGAQQIVSLELGQVLVQAAAGLDHGAQQRRWKAATKH